MKSIIFALILALFGFTMIAAQMVAFTNVNVIPMDKERVLENQTVLVKNGTIAEIGKKVKIPKDAQIIDASGKYLIPGLVDMHTHLLSDGDEYPDSIAEDELKIMAANGVTTIRFMIGTPEQLILRAESGQPARKIHRSDFRRRADRRASESLRRQPTVHFAEQQADRARFDALVAGFRPARRTFLDSAGNRG